MVACAILSVQPYVSLAAPMTTSVSTDGYLDQLKQQLQTAIENADESTTASLVEEIGKYPFTKELLEVTRFGAELNNMRKTIADKWPTIAKKCRNIIKNWQQLVQTTSSSSATTSANGTPTLLGRRLTPATPVGRLLTSTGIIDTRQIISPSAGYAPKSSVSPAPPIHKSQTVASELLAKCEDEAEMRNGKRKAEQVSPSGLKRTKTVAGQLSSPSNLSNQSVLAARRQASLSTADMIAQMSSNLTDAKASDLNSAIRNHQIQVRREEADEQFAQTLAAGAQLQSPYLKGKRKYERKSSKLASQTTNLESKALVNGPKGGIILRLSRGSTITESKEEESEETGTFTLERKDNDILPNTSASTSKIDWMAMLPSLEELQVRASKVQPVKPIEIKDGVKVHIIKGRDRSLLAMPLIPDTTQPDFLVYNYPEQQRFYAEENFLYGRERPKD